MHKTLSSQQHEWWWAVVLSITIYYHLHVADVLWWWGHRDWRYFGVFQPWVVSITGEAIETDVLCVFHPLVVSITGEGGVCLSCHWTHHYSLIKKSSHQTNRLSLDRNVYRKTVYVYCTSYNASWPCMKCAFLPNTVHLICHQLLQLKIECCD